MDLDAELRVAAQAATSFVEPGEELSAVVPAEPSPGERVYLCAFSRADELSWLALDAEGIPVADRLLLRETASVVALCEVAEETAGGGDVEELRRQLAELRERESPEGIDEAEDAAAALARALAEPPRVASLRYLDAVGSAATRLERALGETGGSPFAQAMQAGTGAVQGFTRDVERAYKRPLA